MNADTATKIAQLNDTFRKSGSGIMLTPGIKSIDDLRGLIGLIQAFNDFTPDNDPYGEHDFGVVHWHGEKVFWKIDYFDQALQYGEDPLSKDCRRVLVVMLASDY